MKKVLKLLMYIVLATAVTYFLVSNYYVFGDLAQTVEFQKHGSEKDVIEYVKYINDEMDKTIKESNKTNEKSDSEQEEAKTEKTYKSIDELAVDYPMGATYYSMQITRGEMQIEVLCISFIFGIIIGVNCFLFITDKRLGLKEVAILFGISMGVAIITTEAVGALTVFLAYGAFALPTINLEFLLIAAVIFFFALATNKTVYDIKQNKVAREEEIKEKIAKKLRKNK